MRARPSRRALAFRFGGEVGRPRPVAFDCGAMLEDQLDDCRKQRCVVGVQDDADLARQVVPLLVGKVRLGRTGRVGPRLPRTGLTAGSVRGARGSAGLYHPAWHPFSDHLIPSIVFVKAGQRISTLPLRRLLKTSRPEWHVNFCKWFGGKVIWTKKASLVKRGVQTNSPMARRPKMVPLVSCRGRGGSTTRRLVLCRVASARSYRKSLRQGKMALAGLGLYAGGDRLGLSLAMPQSRSFLPRCRGPA